ncbi:MAG: hypothetical protein DRJ55_06490, partial [Thermoprotei archaeon]
MSREYMAPMLTALIVLGLLANLAYQQPGTEPLYYARIDYILKAKDSGSFNLNEGAVAEITAPPEPAGYELMYLEAKFG